MPVAPDGLPWVALDPLLTWIDGQTTLFESEQEWLTVPTSHPMELESAVSTVHVRFAEDGRTPREAAFRLRTVVDEREVYTYQHEFLLTMDEQGRLIRAVIWQSAGPGAAGPPGWAFGAAPRIVTLERDERGRVAAVVQGDGVRTGRYAPMES